MSGDLAPLARTAVATVVHEGYVRQDDDGQYVGSTRRPGPRR